MIGKIIGAGLGAALSKQTRKIGGPTGAILGTIAVPVLRRLSLPGMIMLAAGGYMAKKLIDKGDVQAPPGPRANV